MATQGKEFRPYQISPGKTQTEQIAKTTTKIIQSAITPSPEGGWGVTVLPKPTLYYLKISGF